MDTLEAIKARRSIRSFKDKGIPDGIAELLRDAINRCNSEHGISLQLVLDDPKCFSSPLAVQFKNARNYLAVVGPAGKEADLGYCGEKIVILAQTLGLSSCWVGLSYSKRNCRSKAGSDEKRVAVIALGYADGEGTVHRNKSLSEVSAADCDRPAWFDDGVRAALLAPTALNRQNFMITLKDGKVSVEGRGNIYPEVNAGIARYHFEVGAGMENFEWA